MWLTIKSINMHNEREHKVPRPSWTHKAKRIRRKIIIGCYLSLYIKIPVFCLCHSIQLLSVFGVSTTITVHQIDLSILVISHLLHGTSKTLSFHSVLSEMCFLLQMSPVQFVSIQDHVKNCSDIGN